MTNQEAGAAPPIVERVARMSAAATMMMGKSERDGIIADVGELVEALEEAAGALKEAVCLIPASQKTALAKFNALLAKLEGSTDVR